MLVNSRRRRFTNEHGAVAILIAILMTVVIVASAFLLDFGLVRVDRQMNKSSSDSAAFAGIKALDRDDSEAHPYAGVCAAVDYLRSSQSELSGLPSSGNGVSCPPSSSQLDEVCVPGVTDVHYIAEVTTGTGKIEVQVRSPYVVSEGPSQEESTSSLSSDTGDTSQGGCDQLGVTITETRATGPGQLTGVEEMTTAVRSAARVNLPPDPPTPVAMLLLEQNDCNVLTVSTTNTNVRVQGNEERPGLIHSDSLGNGSGCSSRNIFYSQPTDGVIVEESPIDANPGQVTVRALSGEPGAVPAEAEIDPTRIVIQPNEEPTGRELVSRTVVDDLYLEHVEAVRDEANAEVAKTAAQRTAEGYTELGCSPTAAQTAGPGPFWVNCTNFSAAATFPDAEKVTFIGRVEANNLSLPKAKEVYITGASSPYGLRVNDFRMNYDAATCEAGSSTTRARLVIGGGQFTHAGSTSKTQMCNTAVLMMGAEADACLGMTYGDTGCTSGIVNITTGMLDWTAPNAVATGGRTDADFAELEDLALWAEASGQTHKLGGSMTLAGVFMVPNAKPFNIIGGGVMDVEDSQFIVQKFDLSGSGEFAMKPDPYNAVPLPELDGFQLIR